MFNYQQYQVSLDIHQERLQKAEQAHRFRNAFQPESKPTLKTAIGRLMIKLGVFLQGNTQESATLTRQHDSI